MGLAFLVIMTLGACGMTGDSGATAENVVTHTVTATATAPASAGQASQPGAQEAAAPAPTDAENRSDWWEREVGDFSIAASAKFSTVVELRDAAQASGDFRCTSWDQTDEMMNADESATCSDNSVLSFYKSRGGLRDQIHTEFSIRDLLENAGAEPEDVLVGYNWIFKSESATDLQSSLGGSTLDELAEQVDTLPTAPARAESVTPDMPVAEDFVIDLRVTEKKCFGSAGCNVTVSIDPSYVGTGPLPESFQVTYEIRGGEDGPQVNTFSVKDDTISYDGEERVSTSSSEVELEAVVTEVWS